MIVNDSDYLLFIIRLNYFHFVYLKILYDFEIRFKALQMGGLHEKWPTMRANMFELVDPATYNACHGAFPDEIGDFITLMKGISKKKSVEDMTKNFIIFSEARVYI